MTALPLAPTLAAELHDGRTRILIDVDEDYGYLEVDQNLSALAYTEARDVIDAVGWQVIDPDDNPPDHLPSERLRWWLEPKEIPSE